MALSAPYPVHVDATLDPQVGRWLWLVKWLLVIPHLFLLFFLWVAFAALSVIAFFAILFTGRYPRSLFEFNVGVLRWSWRVSYYGYGALGTDRYPPFSLAEVPDYPAHLEVSYPAHLSRGLVLVKWWLLAIPQYLVVAVLVGGGTWAAWEADHNLLTWGPGGLIGLLVLVAAVVLLFTGRYPQQLFDLVLGLNRWVLRVAAYAGLMTDEYPPFRLDMGGHESGGTLTLPGPGGPSPEGGAPVEGGGAPQHGGRPPAAAGGWTTGRVVSVVIGSVLALVSFGLLAAGGGLTWLDNTQRDAAGYLTTSTRVLTTGSYALASDRIDLGASNTSAPSSVLGTVRIRVTASNPARAVFVGVASRSAADAYLAGVAHTVVTGWSHSSFVYQYQSGGAPASPPAVTPVWTASASGTGTQTLTWKPSQGEWTVVVMNPDGAPGLSVAANVGATVPDLVWFAVGCFAAGAVLLAGATALIVVPLVRASRPRAPAEPPAGAPGASWPPPPA